jgi:hypothetical protein
MEIITVLTQNLLLFLAGMVTGGYLQHKTNWLDRLAKLLS